MIRIKAILQKKQVGLWSILTWSQEIILTIYKILYLKVHAKKISKESKKSIKNTDYMLGYKIFFLL